MSGQPEQIPAAKVGRERGWRFYLAGLLALLAAIFVIQNTEQTNVTFLFADTTMPLFFALIITLALGAMIGWLTPRVRRSGRERDG